MTRTKFKAVVEFEGNSESIKSVVKFSHNSALAAGKDIIRDLKMGTWSILKSTTKGNLMLQNDRTGSKAVVMVQEVK
jgi:hypothetical protein